MTAEAGTLLGHQMRRRRLALGLSISAAAEATRVNRVTWATWENGVSKPQGHNYAGIEKTLLWAPGSIEHVLAGSDPEEIDPGSAPLSIEDLPEDLRLLIDLYVSPELNDREREDILANARIAYRGTLLSLRQRAEAAGRRPAAPHRRAG